MFRFIVISEILKTGENVHLEINKIWHVKTVALLTKMNRKEYCFEKFKPCAKIFKYAKTSRGWELVLDIVKFQGAFDDINKSLNFTIVRSKVKAPETSICT